MRFVFFISVLLLLSSALASCLRAQSEADTCHAGDRLSTTQDERSRTLPASSLPAAVFYFGGYARSGRLEEITAENIVLSNQDGFIAVPMNEIKELVLPGKTRSGEALVLGLLLGALAGNLNFWTDQSHPGAYLRIHPNAGAWLAGNACFAIGIGGFAYLLTRPSDYQENRFRLGDGATVDESQADRLRAHVMGFGFRRRWHLGVQVASVLPMQKGRAAHVLREVGRSAGDGSRGILTEATEEAASSINLLRRLQLQYSLSPRIRMGFAFMDLSDPTGRESASINLNGAFASISVAPSPKALYLTATFDPFGSESEETLEWLTGIGIGAALLDGQLEGHYREVGAANLNESRSLDGTAVSGTIYTELRVHVTSTLSLGLISDYVFVTPRDIAPISGIDPRGTVLDFSSAAIGLFVGMHF